MGRTDPEAIIVSDFIESYYFKRNVKPHTYYIYKLSATFLCLEIILYIDIMMLFWAVTNNSISPVGSHY